MNTGGCGPLRRLRAPPWPAQPPRWADAEPAVIEAVLRRALARPSGNWFVLCATRELGAGREFGAGRVLGARRKLGV
ncbi:MAG: hypothetical protein M3Z25_19085, partial [Actinomycetota bacterium]|nr:hypothetical protein [Actinomycetota bacterium]